jgi:hypothetical protein
MIPVGKEVGMEMVSVCGGCEADFVVVCVLLEVCIEVEVDPSAPELELSPCAWPHPPPEDDGSVVSQLVNIPDGVGAVKEREPVSVRIEVGTEAGIVKVEVPERW